MKDYLLFDLDGTLTDPKIGITTCVQYALASFGIEEPDLDKLEPFIGPPLLDSFKQFYGMSEEDGLKAVAKYRERFNDVGIFENEIYPGMEKMLKYLKTSGMHLAVASSKPTVFVERILEHFHIQQYFDVVVGSELDGTRSKKSEVVQEALNQLFKGGPVQRESVYMIGDTKYDIEGARECGVESIGVAYGYGGLEQLMDAHADYIVCSVEELRSFLRRSLKEKRQQIKTTPSQRIWRLLYPLLLFVLLKFLTLTAVTMLVMGLDGQLPESVMNLLVIRGENGIIAKFTPNGTLLAGMIAFLVAGAGIRKIARYTIKEAKGNTKLLHLRQEPTASYLLMAGATLGCILGVNLFMLLSGMAKISAEYTSMAEANRQASFLLGLLYYCLVTPIAEELLFRGILYNYLRQPGKTIRMGENISRQIGSAILVSACLFSIYHMNSVQGIYAFVFGCLMAYAYEYFGEFLIPVAMHIFSNFLAWILPMDSLTEGIGWAVCAGSMAMMVFCLVGLQRRKK